MKRGIVIAMLIVTMGLIGCGRYYDRGDRGYDRGHGYEHHDRWNDDHEHRK